MRTPWIALPLAALLLSACQQQSVSSGPQDAKRFLEEVNATLNDLRAGKIVGRVVLTPAA